MEIFKLFGSILVDSSDAEKSISKTGKEAETLGTKLGNGIKTAAKWAAGVTAAAVAVGGAMVAAAKDTASLMDTIDKGAQRMDISAESYQTLAYQAELCGVSMNTMEKAAKKLEGTGMNMDEAIAEIYSLTTAEERAAKAAELFGESVAYEMGPMLNQSASDMANMANEAHALGLVFDENTVKSGANLNDMFTKVQDSLSALKTGLIADFMPYIEEILQWVIETIPVVQEAIQNVLDWVMPYLKPLLEGVMKFIKGIFALISGDFEGFKDGVVGIILGLGEAMFNLGKDIFNALWDGLKEVWGNITDWVTDKVSWLMDKVAFWKKGEDQMQTDGSHASGLPYVPYDGYVAELHRGESVLNAGQVQQLMDKLSNIGSGDGNSSPIEVTLNLDGKTLARELVTPMANANRMRGGSCIV